MVYFIKEEQFNGRFNLVIEDGSFFRDFAEQWEDKWIPLLFGEDMWNDYQADSDNSSFSNFQDKLEGLLKYFFYLEYAIEVESFQSTIGSMEANTENAERNRQSRNFKAVQLWNEGREEYTKTFQYLKGLGTYPNLKSEPTQIVVQNIWSI